MRNLDQIHHIIDIDSELDCNYYDEATGQTCFIGGLLLFAGFNVPKYLGGKQWGIREADRRFPKVGGFLQDTYGMSLHEAELLQHVNDDSRFRGNTQARRAALHTKVNELA